jgi:citrate lyase subunit beta/citryl-CoA lyase
MRFYKNGVRNFSNLSNIKSCLFVPGNSEKMLYKSISVDSDIIVPDLEDSVPLKEKNQAVCIVNKMLPQISGSNKRSLLFPRLNSLYSGLFSPNLNEIMKENHDKIQGFVIPKVDTPHQYQEITKEIEKAEQIYKVNSILKVIIWIESPLGFVNMKEIFALNKNRRIIGAAFGAEDFSNSLGIQRSKDLRELDIARNLFAITAKAFNIIAFDTPYVEFKNEKGLIEEIEKVKKMGFKGKFAIHPSQVNVINKHFLPSESEIQWAKNIIKEYEQAEKAGRGSLSVNNEMIDEPVYKRALSIINKLR